MTQTQHYPDAQLKSAVIDELKWTPSVNPNNIGVSVTDGAVTLSGEVASYPEKIEALKAVQRVHGVHGIAQEMTVRTTYGAFNDTDIAREAGVAIENDSILPKGSVKVVVNDHVVTLSGSLPWNYQRTSAEHAVRYLKGVHDVRNTIVIKPVASATGIKTAIATALVRHAVLDAERCDVTSTTDGDVTLEGHVGSWGERKQAENVAWAAPGVRSVVNKLEVR
jgi:osmotically-inducible protein OsmY